MSANSETQPFYSFLRKGKFAEAINWLEQFSFASFEAIFFYSIQSHGKNSDVKPPFFNKGAFISYFFKDYLYQSKYFNDVCTSSRKREWFEQLFMRSQLLCPLLYKRMAEGMPNCLIEALKRNRVPFLKQEQFAEILKYGDNPELKEFLKKAGTMSLIEYFYFAKAIKSSRQLKGKSIEEILCLVALWIYYYTWDLTVNQNNPDQERLKETAAVESMNHFLSHFLRCKTSFSADKNFDIEKFQDEIVKGQEKAPPYYDVFLFWNSWHRYVSTYVDEFCFSDSTEIIISKNAITSKKYDPIEMEKYIYNGIKLHVYDQFEKEDFEEMKINFKTSKNQQKLIKYLSPELNRDYRNLIDEFTESIYYKKYKIPIETAHAYAIGFITPFRILFSHVSEQNKLAKTDWKDILTSISTKKIHNQYLYPLTLVNPNPKETINTEYFIDKEHQLEEAALTYDSFSIDLLNITFSNHYNRFKEDISLGSAFRFKLGNKTYSFPQISSSLRLHTFLTNLALKIHRNSEEQKLVNDQMEEHIAKLAIDKKLSALSKFKYSFRDKNDEHVPGEIDGIIFETNHILGIEFKHSPLKSSLEEISREREITLEIASRQLDRFGTYLKKDPEDLYAQLKISDKSLLSKFQYTGLIVTTNFEYDHEKINGKYLKISWKEWIWVLENIKEGCKIHDIIELIEMNTYWEKVMKIKQNKL